VLALLLLAVALGLSNFAAAIGIGVSGVRGGTRVRMAVVFGVFEAGMPVLGLLLGRGAADGIGQAARWLGGAALIAFGAFGLIQGWRGGGDRAAAGGAGRAAAGGAGRAAAGGSGRAAGSWPMGRLLVSGLVLSGDNLAAGFALGAYHVGVGVAATAFGLVSVVMSLAGLELGARIGAAAGERAELVAGALLVAAGAAIAAGALLVPACAGVDAATCGFTHWCQCVPRSLGCPWCIPWRKIGEVLGSGEVFVHYDAHFSPRSLNLPRKSGSYSNG
jgi:manganese efflux pump family protein